MKVSKKNVVAKNGFVYVKVGQSVYRFNHVPVSNPETLVARVQAAGKIDPGRWVKVVAKKPGTLRPTIECGKCKGTGAYVYPGGNGRTGTCFACQGKGTQDDADQRRNWGYRNHH